MQLSGEDASFLKGPFFDILFKASSCVELVGIESECKLGAWEWNVLWWVAE